jgi:hypothetical protein
MAVTRPVTRPLDGKPPFMPLTIDAGPFSTQIGVGGVAGVVRDQPAGGSWATV